MAQNLREQIAIQLVSILKNMTDPSPVLVNREPFEADKLAITQFPALLVQMDKEERESVTMGIPGAGRRAGVITWTIRGFVRGVELDSKRNDLIERIEESLDQDRYLGLRTSGVLDSQVTLIEIVNRLAPLAEFRIEFQVKYNYVRGLT